MIFRKKAIPLSAVLAAALLLGSALACKAEISAQQTLRQTLSVKGPVHLEVTTSSGDIHVRAGANGEVAILGKTETEYNVTFFGLFWHHDKNGVIDHLPIKQQGNQIQLGPLPENSNLSLDYWITVPQGSTLVLHSASGDVDVSGVDGPLAAKTLSGDINASNLNGRVQLNDLSGDINASIDQSPQVSVEDTSGDIHLHNVHGALTVHDISGDTTVSGAPGQNWNINNVSGDITLDLRNAGPFLLNTHTVSGDINTHHVNGNGPTVNLGNVSGDITVHESQRTPD